MNHDIRMWDKPTLFHLANYWKKVLRKDKHWQNNMIKAFG